MILYLGILLIQIVCIVHVIRNGRNQLWIMALMFLPMASAVAYLIVEVLPGFTGHRHVRAAQAAAVARLDPEREIRAARDQLSLADTVANRVRLADALVALERWGEALPLYQEARGMGASDWRTGYKLARVQFETGDARAALATLDALTSPSAQSDQDRHGLLRARALAELGRGGEAAALYADLVTRLPGEEARCRYAALLLEQGRRAEARAVLEEVEARAKRLTRAQRAAEADMYRWAGEQLRSLRA